MPLEYRDNVIVSFFHCGHCLRRRPPTVSPQDWARLEVGFTKEGLQVWCRRCESNVVHIDFEGHKHPAVLARRAGERRGEIAVDQALERLVDAYWEDDTPPEDQPAAIRAALDLGAQPPEKYCTYPACKCIVSTSTSQPEPVCPKGLKDR